MGKGMDKKKETKKKAAKTPACPAQAPPLLAARMRLATSSTFL